MPCQHFPLVNDVICAKFLQNDILSQRNSDATLDFDPSEVSFKEFLTTLKCCLARQLASTFYTENKMFTNQTFSVVLRGAGVLLPSLNAKLS